MSIVQFKSPVDSCLDGGRAFDAGRIIPPSFLSMVKMVPDGNCRAWIFGWHLAEARAIRINERTKRIMNSSGFRGNWSDAKIIATRLVDNGRGSELPLVGTAS